MKQLKARCDHCGKWVNRCMLFTFNPEDVEYLELNNIDEFIRCSECCTNKDYNLDYWKEWIKKKRVKIIKRGKRFV